MPASSAKLVLDTSALVSLAHGDLLDLTLAEFGVVISNHVHDELRQMSAFDDPDGRAATDVLARLDDLDMRAVERAEIDPLRTSKIDEGEASCVVLAQAPNAAALISDDFDAMHQMRAYAQTYGFDLGLGAVVVHALLKRGRLGKDDALGRLDQIAAQRGWMGRPIYRAYRRAVESEEIG